MSESLKTLYCPSLGPFREAGRFSGFAAYLRLAKSTKAKVCFETGKAAQTEYQVLEYEEQATRVKLSPITGRSHQLRVHMLALGHPILEIGFMPMSKRVHLPLAYSFTPKSFTSRTLPMAHRCILAANPIFKFIHQLLGRNSNNTTAY